MRALMVRFKPTVFEDIIALVALYRPGPMETGMHDDYVSRKHGEAKVEYFLPQMEPILQETYGVILYQEQVMQIAAAVSGFSLAEADLLRRAMGKKDPVVMAAQRNRFVSGAVDLGVAKARGTELFNLIEKFAGYGFNKSHSAAYALVAYQTAFLKAHYPLEFLAAVLNSEINNTTALARHIMEARDQRASSSCRRTSTAATGTSPWRTARCATACPGSKTSGWGPSRRSWRPGARATSRASGISWSASVSTR